MLRTDLWARLIRSTAGCLVISMGATAALAQDASTNSDDASSEGVLEEVVVTGTKRNLEKALEIKRDSSTIVDALSYDDIGSFPALDLGEALQAIPGVQINREGERRLSEINLRGLPGGFVKVLANGQGFATPARSNGNPATEQNPFGSFDAQVFDGVTVIKSPSADIPEGGIAGTVDKQLARALSKKDGFTVKLETRYEELNDSWDPSVVLGGTKHIIPDVLAVTFKLAWSEQNFRRDSVQNNAYTALPSSRFPGLAAWKEEKGIPAGDTVQYNRDTRQFTEYNEGDRLSFVGGLEWAPTDELKLGVDLLYTKRDMDDSTLEILQIDTRSRGGLLITPIGDPFYAGADNNGNGVWVVPEYSFENARYSPGNRVFQFLEEARGVFFNGVWERDNWTVDGNLSLSDSYNEFNQEQYQGLYIYSGGRGGVDGSLSSGAGNMNDYYINITGWEGLNWDQPFAFTGTPADDISVRGVDDNRSYFYIGGGANNRDRKNVNYDLNATYRFEFKGLESIKFGIRGTSEDFALESYNNSVNGAQIGNISGAFFTAPHYTGSTNFFGGNAPGFLTYENGWLSMDAFGIRDAMQPVDNPNGLTVNPFSGYLARTLGDQVTNRTISSNFDAKMDTMALYLMGNFGWTINGNRNIWGNVGVRYVETDYSGNGNSLINGVFQPETAKNDYDNWLPSINLNMDLREDLIVRAAYSETMVRPALSSFKPSGTLSEGQMAVNINLPGSELDAYTAQSYDLSLEWYNRKGSAITLALYRKKVQAQFEIESICPEDGGGFGYGPLELIDNGGGDVQCYISEPFYNENTGETYLRDMNIKGYVNSDNDVTLDGYEISIQQNLDFLPAPWNGFGGLINYSHVDAENDDGDTELLPGVSPESYNLIAYWQNEKLNFRLSYNYRDEYKLTGTGSFGGLEDRYVKARGQLDFLATWNAWRKLQLGFRVYNLTETTYEEYKGDNTMKVGRTNWDGRIYAVSAQYRF